MTVDKNSGYTMEASSAISWELNMLNTPYGQLDTQTISKTPSFNITNVYTVNQDIFLNTVYPLVTCQAVFIAASLGYLTTLVFI